ncbi:glutathione S-transferase [Podospora fimiseda]|uniref:Glutathione S-transferase n=1 Tax=Podospora fimiseda TaxID=252190 RepID=A0AAN7H0Z5_9PEZI|nr:glutathione S-transferase [Podospora fimiseda]
MAPLGKIYTYPDNYRVQRALALAALNGLEIEIPAFQMGVDNKSPSFLSKFPYGKVPAFESADGTFTLTEGQAIARYVADSGPKSAQLLGADPQTRAKIEEWACFADQEFAANMIPALLMTIANIIPFDAARYAQSTAGTERALKRIDEAVKGKKFVVGDELTFADVMLLGPLQLATKFLVDEEMRKSAPNVEGYLRGLLEIPELKAQFGDLVLCEKRVGGQ